MTRFALILLSCFALSACFDGGSHTSSASSTASIAGDASATAQSSGQTVAGTITATVPVKVPFAIQGVPASKAVVGHTYTFSPKVTLDTSRLTFSIRGQPTWTQFDASTGVLKGTPTLRDVGTTAGITITATNGRQQATVGPFAVEVATPADTGAASPQISGTPASSVVAGAAYSFVPAVTATEGATLTFTIQNAPVWATFNAATGALTGTPTAANVGTYGNIVITVSDGTNSASLPAFSIAVTAMASGSATLSWTAPTVNVDGTAVSNLAGYKILYGNSASNLTQVIQVTSPAVLSYVVSNLAPGTWYFSVEAYTTAGVSSQLSAVGSATIL